MLEICVDNFESIESAINGGAHRIELCSALSEGGLTPSVGFMKIVKQIYPSTPIFAMLRTRGGNDFVYNDFEIKTIIEDMNSLRLAGADGFVFGALLPKTVSDNQQQQQQNDKRKINEEQSKLIIKHSYGLPVTFHRAFDLTDPNELLENIKLLKQLGYTRLLTSGFAKTAFLGKNFIKKMNTISNGLIIMAGSGVNLDNCEELLRITGCKEFHGSAGHSGTDFRSEIVNDINFGSLLLTDKLILEKMVKIGNKFL